MQANDKTRIAGTPNPSFDLSFTGLVGGDTGSVFTGYTLGTSATQGSPAGIYAINLSGGSASNYYVTDVNGTLNVTGMVVPNTVIIVQQESATNLILHTSSELLSDPGMVHLYDKQSTSNIGKTGGDSAASGHHLLVVDPVLACLNASQHASGTCRQG